METTYSADEDMNEQKHKDGGEKRHLLDKDVTDWVYEELTKHSYPSSQNNTNSSL